MPTASKQGHKKNWGAAAQHGLARKEGLGNTNTPMDVARMIVAITLHPRIAALAKSKAVETWLEPAVGAGNFYMAVMEEVVAAGLEPLAFASRFHAVDIDAEAIAVLRRRLGEAFGWNAAILAALPIACASLADYAPGQAFDAILTNPPYLAPRNWSTDPDQRTALRAAWSAAVPGLDARADLYLYFFHWANRHLAPGGESVFLCADGWLDASFGATLRAELSSPDFVLREIRSWPWKPLFRDDTCPVVTVVQRASADSTATRLVQDDADPLSPARGAVYAASPSLAPVSTALLGPAQRAAWLGAATANRRQRLVTPPDLWDRLEATLAATAPHTVPLGSVAQATSFGWSLADFERAGLLLAQPGATGRKDAAIAPPDPRAWTAGTPIFFQKQARVGKPVDYAIARSGHALACRLAAHPAAAADLHAKALRAARHAGVWLSLAIDRMPLLFVPEDQAPDEAWVGVSKYVHLAPRSEAVGFRDPSTANALLAALMLSTPALLWMDRNLKEGTRKTLRRGENGYAKEVRVPDVCALQIPDPAHLVESGAFVVSSLRRLATRSVSRMEVLLADPDWQRLDDIVAENLGIAPAARAAMRRLVLALYWRRMRNVANYGSAAAACLADPVQPSLQG